MNALIWRCGHPRTLENTANNSHGYVTCRFCRRVSRVRHDNSLKGKATSRARGARYRQNPKSKLYQIQRDWRRRGHDPSFTKTDYQAMLIKQGGRCAICKRLPEEIGQGKRRLAADHNHVTGKVRGLLCFSCNTRIERVLKILASLDAA